MAWNYVLDHPLLVKEFDNLNTVLGYVSAHPAYNIMSRVPINSLEDFKGLRIRAIGDLATLMKMMGATPIACTAHEIYTGIDRGLFDAVLFCGSAFFANWKIHEVLKDGYYIKGLDICPAVGHYMINKDSYNALPTDLKEIIKGLKWEMPAVDLERLESPAVENYFLDKFKFVGMKITYFPEAERKKMVEKFGPPIWEKWMERTKESGGEEFFEIYKAATERALGENPNGIYKEKPLPPDVDELLHSL
jgi:TRAP-type C4-dicarboxylate transport system substrate-binding protein